MLLSKSEHFWPILNLNDVIRRVGDVIALTWVFYDLVSKNKPMCKFELPVTSLQQPSSFSKMCT